MLKVEVIIKVYYYIKGALIILYNTIKINKLNFSYIRT